MLVRMVLLLSSSCFQFFGHLSPFLLSFILSFLDIEAVLDGMPLTGLSLKKWDEVVA